MTGPRTVPVDARLPRLAAAVDTHAMAQRIQALLSARGERARVRGCDIERIKYRPGRNCVVAYRLSVTGESGPAERRVSACFHEAGEARRRYESARAEVSAATESVFLDPAIDAVVRLFPSDRKLRELPSLTSGEDVIRTQLPGLLEARWENACDVHGAAHRIVSYFPDHTCTAALDVKLRMRGRGDGRAWRVFGKMHHDDAGADTFAVMQHLWSVASRRADDAGYARPIAYDSARRILWQEGIAAPTLQELLERGAVTDRVLDLVTRAVAGLHATPATPERRRTPADLLEEIDLAAGIVARARPDLSDQVASLARILVSRSRHPDPGGVATLHGDLHARNILVGHDRAYLIDLDRVSLGPPLHELGSLLAEIAGRPAYAGELPDARPLARIVARYRAASALAFPVESASWHCAAGLLCGQARRAVTSLKPGWHDVLPRLVGAARWILANPWALAGDPGASGSTA